MIGDTLQPDLRNPNQKGAALWLDWKTCRPKNVIICCLYPAQRLKPGPCDIAFPCACENEMDVEDAQALVHNGCSCVTECANMPLNLAAIDCLLQNNILYSPGKAPNAGGVVCSRFEMAQNSTKLKWTQEEVDSRLKQVMGDIHTNCLQAAELYSSPGNYLSGANIAGFIRVANAMLDQGNN